MIEDLSKTLTWTPGEWKTRPSRTEHPTLPASTVRPYPTLFKLGKRPLKKEAKKIE